MMPPNRKIIYHTYMDFAEALAAYYGVQIKEEFREIILKTSLEAPFAEVAAYVLPQDNLDDWLDGMRRRYVEIRNELNLQPHDPSKGKTLKSKVVD